MRGEFSEDSFDEADLEELTPNQVNTPSNRKGPSRKLFALAKPNKHRIVFVNP